jgi:hypothetical protein
MQILKFKLETHVHCRLNSLGEENVTDGARKNIPKVLQPEFYFVLMNERYLQKIILYITSTGWAQMRSSALHD